jgi:hypothetical protein
VGSSLSSILPAGWLDRFFGNADLEASYAELEGGAHFHCETMRGRIRSLQLRIDDGWDHFDAALEMVDDADEDIPNLVRQFVLEVYRFDHALVEAPLDPSMEVPPLEIPLVSPGIVRGYPEIRYVLTLRKRTEALLRLHTGDVATAIQLYDELLRASRRRRAPDKLRPHVLVYYYLGLAACYHAQDDEGAVRIQLDNASLAAATIELTLNRADAAARLAAFYDFLEDRSSAREWKEFLLGLDCPDATKQTFLRRAARLQERCSQLGRLVLL